jgi:hypothetical protein
MRRIAPKQPEQNRGYTNRVGAYNIVNELGALRLCPHCGSKGTNLFDTSKHLDRKFWSIYAS